MTPILLIGIGIHYFTIKPIKKSNKDRIVEINNRLDSINNFQSESIPIEKTLLEKIHNELSEKYQDLENPVNLKGNTLLIYDDKFGDIADVYQLEETLKEYFPEIIIKRIKKKI